MKKPQSITSVFNTAKASKSHFQQLKENLRSRMAFFTSGRDRESQKELEADFANVLDKWGISSLDNIHDVISTLRLRIMILATLPALYGIIFIFIHSLNGLLVFLMLAIPCLFGILTTAWRIWILQNMRFMSFTRWLACGCGYWT